MFSQEVKPQRKKGDAIGKRQKRHSIQVEQTSEEKPDAFSPQDTL